MNEEVRVERRSRSIRCRAGALWGRVVRPGRAAGQPDRPLAQQDDLWDAPKGRRRRSAACGSRSSGRRAPRFVFAAPDDQPGLLELEGESTAATTSSAAGVLDLGARLGAGGETSDPASAGRAGPPVPDRARPAHPVGPVAGETFELRATTPGGTSSGPVELSSTGPAAIVARLRGPRSRTSTTTGASPRLESARATSRTPSRDSASSVAGSRGLPSCRLSRPARCSLPLRGREEHRRWFEAVAGSWQPDGGDLQVESEDEQSVDASSRERRLAATAISPTGCASRSGSSRASASSGSASGSTALDQRGRLVDTAVFDQYKGQGARSYLPMPFAIVVGGGFGFHVDTGRGCGSTSAHRDPGLIGSRSTSSPASWSRAPLRLFAGDPAVLRTSSPRRPPAAPPPDWIYRLWMSGNEWNTQARVLEEVAQRGAGHPGRRDRDRGLVRRVDIRRLQRRRVRAPSGRLPAPPRRLPLPGGRPLARPEGNGRRPPRAGNQGAALADPARAREPRPGACRPRDDDRARLLRAPRRRAAVPESRLVVPRRAACRTSPTPRRASGGSKNAATCSRSSASTASRPTAASTRGAPICAMPTAGTAARRTTATRCSTATPTTG